MRVFCIRSAIIGKQVIQIKKGNIYTVIDEAELGNYSSEGVPIEPGIYYQLIETGHWYNHSLFIKVNDTEIDETEFERNEYLLTPLGLEDKK